MPNIRHRLLQKETWERVVELNALGWWSDKNKRFLFSGKVPEEYKLPLKLAIARAIVALSLIFLLASQVFSFVGNIVLIVMMVMSVFLENYMVYILSKKERKREREQ